MPINMDQVRNDLNKLKKILEPIQALSDAMAEIDAVNSELEEKRGQAVRYSRENDAVLAELAAAKDELAAVRKEVAEVKAKAKKDAQEREQKSKDKATEIVVGATSMRDAVLKEHVQAKSDLAATKLELGKRQTELDDLNMKIEKAKDVVKNIFSNPVD